MTITREALTHAAETGAALDHLTAGQVWAAHKLAIPPERLQKPLAPHIITLLENVERKARRHFFGGVKRNDTTLALPASCHLSLVTTLSEHAPWPLLGRFLVKVC